MKFQTILKILYAIAPNTNFIFSNYILKCIFILLVIFARVYELTDTIGGNPKAIANEKSFYKQS